MSADHVAESTDLSERTDSLGERSESLVEGSGSYDERSADHVEGSSDQRERSSSQGRGSADQRWRSRSQPERSAGSRRNSVSHDGGSMFSTASCGRSRGVLSGPRFNMAWRVSGARRVQTVPRASAQCHLVRSSRNSRAWSWTPRVRVGSSAICSNPCSICGWSQVQR
jgi:hypothetical protein